jgi:Cdc6-like AAA superfamily ATPase
MSTLSDHHRIVLGVLEEFGPSPATQLFSRYRSACTRLKTRPVARRTFTNYMAKLTVLGLVQAQRADGRGNEHFFRLQPAACGS